MRSRTTRPTWGPRGSSRGGGLSLEEDSTLSGSVAAVCRGSGGELNYSIKRQVA